MRPRHRLPNVPIRDRGRLPLALAGLTAMAVSQPLFQLLGQQASFFIAHHLDRLDLLVFVLTLGLLVPALPAVLTLVAGVFGSHPRAWVGRLFLLVLVAFFVLALLRSIGDPLAGSLALAVAATAALASNTAWKRNRAFGRGLALLVAAVPIFAGLFVWQTATAGLWEPRAVAEAEGGDTGDSLPPPARPASPDPIVWVVFDELPLASLLDEDAQIDAELYPHFAALSATATWFRNASTVWSHTERSITSMLTGRLADADLPTTRAHYPANLLTWLRASHAVHASELVTRLAPSTGHGSAAPLPSRKGHWRALTYDVALLYAHRVLPPTLATGLPPVDTRWGHFERPGAVASHDETWQLAVHDERGRRFADFLTRLEASSPPPFFFEHVMLPHMPSRFLPSRKVYSGRPVYGPPSQAWLEDEQYALEVYKRHLVQVGFVDRLLGDLVATLRRTGLYERTLLIVTSDHGASYWPGENRRVPGLTAHPDDILRIPLFIKAPGQTTGILRDDNVQTFDLPSTVADFLDVELPWRTAGRSIRSPATPRPPSKTLCDPQTGCSSLHGALTLDRATLRRKVALFDPTRGDDRWASQGPYRDLIGQPVSAWPSAAPAPCDAVLDQLRSLRAHDPAGTYAPAQWSGQLSCRSPLPAATALALASHGHVRATTALREVDGEPVFSVFFGDHALVAGDNEPAIYIIEGGPESVALAPVSIREPVPCRSKQR